MKTKAQQDFILAERLVSEVDTDENVRKIYGGLCHSFPVLVRTCGLCQAVAFSKDKEQSGDPSRKRAHELLLQHVGALLEVADPLTAIRSANAAQYMLSTRRILSAWIYFKRFAVSILKVEGAEQN